MTKIHTIGFLIAVLLLVACGGGAADTAEDPEPVPVTDVTTMTGLWFRPGDRHKAYIRFDADGTYRMAFDRENVANAPDAHGMFWFEDGQFHIEDSGYGDTMDPGDQCPDIVGRYEVVSEGGDKLIFSITDDSCEPRSMSLTTALGLTRVDG